MDQIVSVLCDGGSSGCGGSGCGVGCGGRGEMMVVLWCVLQERWCVGVLGVGRVGHDAALLRNDIKADSSRKTTSGRSKECRL